MILLTAYWSVRENISVNICSFGVKLNLEPRSLSKERPSAFWDVRKKAATLKLKQNASQKKRTKKCSTISTGEWKTNGH